MRKNYLVFQARKTVAGCQDCSARMNCMQVWTLRGSSSYYELGTALSEQDNSEMDPGHRQGLLQGLNGLQRVLSVCGGHRRRSSTIRAVEGD